MAGGPSTGVIIGAFVFLLFIFAIAGGGYYMYKNKNSSGSQGPQEPQGDTITIGTNGVTKSGGSTTETYLDMPLTAYCSQPSRPSWCNLTPTSEMQYVYDPVGGSANDNGGFTTTFNNNTGLCSDGTRDCIYTEVYNSDRILTDIVNEKGESMVKKFVDDLWSDKIQISDTSKDLFKKMVTFEDGKLYMLMEDGTTKLQIIPGSNAGPTTDGKMVFTPGMIILYIAFYYKFNNKTKPSIKVDLKSDKPIGATLLAST